MISLTETANLHHINSLEAATSRLEDIALAQQSQQLIGNVPGPSGQPAAGAAAGVAGSGAPAAPAASTTGATGAQDNTRVKAFQDLIDGPLKKYGELSSDIGGLVAEQVRVRYGGTLKMQTLTDLSLYMHVSTRNLGQASRPLLLSST